jgi:hypothetical protein
VFALVGVAWSAVFAELRGSSCGAVNGVGVGSLENRETAARGRATMPGCVRLICTRVQGSKSRRASWIGVDRRSSLSSSLDRLFVLSSRRARSKASCKMRYRLPLELELTIIELAAPPLAINRLHDRVAFFIKISLMHRSLTAWAQERLRDQFLYTYHTRPDEHERLEKRFEAGFGHNRPLRRLYLDLTRLPTDINEREEPGTDSVSVTVKGHVIPPTSLLSRSDDPEQVGSKAREQASEAVAHYVYPANDSNDGRWELCTVITSYSQVLDTLWVKLPYLDLNIKNLPCASAVDSVPWRLSATQG